MRVYLERIEPEGRLARFYTVMLMPTLLGEWAVVREWGRIGQGGTVREKISDRQEDAVSAAEKLVASKLRRGYQVRG